MRSSLQTLQPGRSRHRPCRTRRPRQQGGQCNGVYTAQLTSASAYRRFQITGNAWLPGLVRQGLIHTTHFYLYLLCEFASPADVASGCCLAVWTALNEVRVFYVCFEKSFPSFYYGELYARSFLFLIIQEVPYLGSMVFVRVRTFGRGVSLVVYQRIE